MSGIVVDERYRICEPLGAGGMGTVYRAERIRIGRVVAIKFLQRNHAAEADFVKRFEREALALGRLYHPHCVGLIDFGVSEGRPYLVMDYVPGKTLEELLRDGPLAPRRAIRIMRQLLATLEYFHGRNVVHRDLKAANVMLMDSEDETDFVKLLDFGMAKLLGGVGANLEVSMKGTVVGTPSSMSPEQIRELPIDGRTDIYSAGILLYHMVVGRKPFMHSDMVEVLKMHLERDPEPPRKILGERHLSRELERCILTALAKDRDQRFQSAAEMAAALEKVPEAARTEAPKVQDPPPPPSPRRLVWLALTGWTAFLLLCATIAVILLVFPAELDRFRDPQRKTGGTVAPIDAGVVTARAMPADAGVTSPRSSAAAALVDAAAAIPDAAAAAPLDAGMKPTRPWGPRRDRATALIAAGKHRAALREIKRLLREHPAASADPEVIRLALGTLADPRGDQNIGYLAQVIGRQPLAIELSVRAVSSGQSWYVRHHAWWLLERIGESRRADEIAMYLADLKDADDCARVRTTVFKLSRSRDPRAQKQVSEIRARPPSDRQARCLPRR